MKKKQVAHTSQKTHATMKPIDMQLTATNAKAGDADTVESLYNECRYKEISATMKILRFPVSCP